jgi:hypothetical protein
VAIGCLVGGIHSHRDRLRKAALDGFAAFDRPATGARLKAICRT